MPSSSAMENSRRHHGYKGEHGANVDRSRRAPQARNPPTDSRNIWISDVVVFGHRTPVNRFTNVKRLFFREPENYRNELLSADRGAKPAATCKTIFDGLGRRCGASTSPSVV